MVWQKLVLSKMKQWFLIHSFQRLCNLLWVVARVLFLISVVDWFWSICWRFTFIFSCKNLKMKMFVEWFERALRNADHDMSRHQSFQVQWLVQQRRFSSNMYMCSRQWSTTASRYFLTNFINWHWRQLVGLISFRFIATTTHTSCGTIAFFGFNFEN